MFRFAVPAFVILLTLVCCVAAQDRDYLTDEEIELVRNNQTIDSRTEILVHAVDRRLTVLNLQTAGVEKPKDNWGPLPKGTRLELLNDIKRIIQKAVDDIDNLSERPDSAVDEDVNTGKKNKPFTELFPKAVRTLASAATRYKPIFAAELDKSKDNAEKGILMDSIDMCDEITASVAKLPAEVKQVTGKSKH